MTSPDLVRTIRAALDALEAKAQRAPVDPIAAVVAGLEAYVTERTPGPLLHDPAAVLRQVAANRRVLDRHQPRMLPATHYRPEVVECEHCVRMCHSRSGLACDDPTDAPWPCDEILDLADRLGIDPEET